MTYTDWRLLWEKRDEFIFEASLMAQVIRRLLEPLYLS